MQTNCRSNRHRWPEQVDGFGRIGKGGCERMGAGRSGRIGRIVQLGRAGGSGGWVLTDCRNGLIGCTG